MNITIVQMKLRTADFDYNYNKIISALEQTKDADLIVFPQNTVSGEGCKDFAKDKFFIETQNSYINKLLRKPCNIPFLIHVNNKYILIKNGQQFPFDGSFNKNKISIASKLQDAICDVFIWTQSIPFSLNSNVEKQACEFAVKNSCQVIYLNSCTMADEHIYAGESFAVDENGKMGFRLPICDEKIENLFDGPPLDQRDYAASPMGTSLRFFSHNELSCNRVNTDFCEEQKISKVLSFALKEYCRANGFKKIVTGLSGGIDSALTMAIATAALGRENVLGILMPSEYSSAGSVDDSLQLARNLGIKTDTLPIDTLVTGFMNGIARARIQDLAEENLQARLRGLIVMFYSNREGYLVLSNGNKSEIAVGYSTLYGDMAGGLNLIADLTKQRVYKLAKWLNRNGEIIPRSIIEKEPSAELRPNQKDQDTLPPYEILDDIIEMYIERGFHKDDICKKHGKARVDEIIKKIVRTQYKRNQACLGIRLTNRAFCSNVKLPIMQGLY